MSKQENDKLELPVPYHVVVLSVLEVMARQLQNHIATPPNGMMSPEDIRTHIAKMYQSAEVLVSLAETARAKAQADAEKNGEAPAEQVN